MFLNFEGSPDSLHWGDGGLLLGLPGIVPDVVVDVLVKLEVGLLTCQPVLVVTEFIEILLEVGHDLQQVFLLVEGLRLELKMLWLFLILGLRLNFLLLLLRLGLSWLLRLLILRARRSGI